MFQTTSSAPITKLHYTDISLPYSVLYFARITANPSHSITVRLIMKHSEEKQYTHSSDPENFIPKFRRRNLDKTGFLNKLARFAGRLGEPLVRLLYALDYLWESPHPPRIATMIFFGPLF